MKTTPGKPAKLILEADFSNRKLKADGADVIFIYASVTDALGNLNHDSTIPIRFSVEGDATFVGLNPVLSAAGIATILLKSGRTAGKIILIAESDTMALAKIVIESF